MKATLFAILVVLMSIAQLAQAGDAAISISIAVPALDPGSERSVVAFDRTSHFPVILTNTSDKPQRIVTEWNSWGDHALSFELTDDSGKKFTARRVVSDYAKNTLHWWILKPQESMVLDVYFADSDRWQGFPHPVGYGNSQTVTMRAVFEVKSNEVPVSDGLWVGRIVSQPDKYVFYNRTSKSK
jgi:hypothetical protein